MNELGDPWTINFAPRPDIIHYSSTTGLNQFTYLSLLKMISLIYFCYFFITKRLLLWSSQLPPIGSAAFNNIPVKELYKNISLLLHRSWNKNEKLSLKLFTFLVLWSTYIHRWIRFFYLPWTCPRLLSLSLVAPFLLDSGCRRGAARSLDSNLTARFVLIDFFIQLQPGKGVFGLLLLLLEELSYNAVLH